MAGGRATREAEAGGVGGQMVLEAKSGDGGGGDGRRGRGKRRSSTAGDTRRQREARRRGEARGKVGANEAEEAAGDEEAGGVPTVPAVPPVPGRPDQTVPCPMGRATPQAMHGPVFHARPHHPCCASLACHVLGLLGLVLARKSNNSQLSG